MRGRSAFASAVVLVTIAVAALTAVPAGASPGPGLFADCEKMPGLQGLPLEDPQHRHRATANSRASQSPMSRPPGGPS